MGKFIGLAKDAKKFGLQEDEEIDEDEDEDDEEESKKKEDLDTGAKMFTKTQIVPGPSDLNMVQFNRRSLRPGL